MLSYQGEAEDRGAMIAFHAGFRRATPTADGFEVEVDADGGATRLRTRLLVNAAGLFAGAAAAAIEGLAPPFRRTTHYCKGTYFSVAGRVPFARLIYPVPERDGLGVHLTLDMAGAGRFGPDTEWIADVDYGLDPRRGDGFYAAIRRYWPDLKDGALSPSYTGVRPKLHPEGGPATDFAIEGPEVHGLPGLVNLFGIESPGLTASLAIAEEVLERVELRAAA
jgi:L-2-hydroxyglutarate oxidase LhgO